MFSLCNVFCTFFISLNVILFNHVLFDPWLRERAMEVKSRDVIGGLSMECAMSTPFTTYQHLIKTMLLGIRY